MILLLLLVVAAFHAVHAEADITPCPDGSACLYHARCKQPKEDGQENVFVTMESSKYYQWKAVECAGNEAFTAELFIEPLTNRRWKGTFKSKTAKIDLGKLSMNNTNVEVMDWADISNFNARHINATETDYIPDFTVWFTIESSNTKKLKDIFASTEIIYYEEGMKDGSTKSQQPEFWAKIQLLTPSCDKFLIVDDAAAHDNQLDEDKERAKCRVETENMWLQTENSKWQQLDTLTCDSNKEWEAKYNDAVIQTTGKLTILCAVKEPAPWTTTTTTTTTSTTTGETTTSTSTTIPITPTTAPTNPTTSTTTTTGASSASTTTTTAESPTTSTKIASGILHSLIVPILISALLLI